MIYGIWQNNNWYSDMTNGLMENGDPFPSIFQTIEDAKKYVSSQGIKKYIVKEIRAASFCSLIYEEGSEQCKFCDCQKQQLRYE